MKICAVISEFNPFHNGHKYLLSALRSRGNTHIVAIMSTYFTQRGDVASVRPAERTRMALSAGTDLVIGLPTCFSLSPAEIFAKGAAYLIKSMGCVDSLGFGSECENIKDLIGVSQKLDRLDSNLIKKLLKDGVTYSKARQQALEYVCNSGFSDVISRPNNILAVEYIRALEHFNLNLNLELVPRKNAQHDDNFSYGTVASSSFIRDKILKNEPFKNYMPPHASTILTNELNTLRAPAHIKTGERAVLAFLRMLTPPDLANIQDVSEGLENRIYQAIRQATSIEELYALIKTKRYTMARIRRIVLSAFLGLNKEIQNTFPPYIRVLGFNKSGSEVLKKMKATASLPIITKYSEVLKSNDEKIKKFFNMESKVGDLYSLFTPKISKCGQEMVNSPQILN